MRDERFDVVVVGAGPAGLAAAASAAMSGASVAIVDDNPGPGGQIWRRQAGEPVNENVAPWLDALAQDRVRQFQGTTIVDANGPRTLFAVDGEGAVALRNDTLVLATGATELLLPFPGWTLPNAFGAGGLQALVKSGWDVTGRRAVVAGSGPLLLAVGAHLREHGAEVVCIAEQSPRSRVVTFGASLVARPAKLAQALALRSTLRGVRQEFSSWPLRAEGRDRVERVVLHTARGERTLECDLLASGFGLVPQTTIGRYLGCEVEGDALVVDRLQETSIRGVWAAGEVTGIGGVDKAIVEGRIAGFAAVGMSQRARALFSSRDREIAFARRLVNAFALRDELRAIATNETIVCRCEDVELGRVRAHASIRDAKLKTRCGMGPCQGRVCGPALGFLERWPRDRVRPPLFPVTVEALAEIGRDR